MKRMRTAGFWTAFAMAAVCAPVALGQLNPTVNVLPRPQTPVPGECEQGLAPAQPRVVIAEKQPEPPKPAAAPPTLDLKTRLRALQTAAEQGDRDAFKSALAAVRATIAAYPAGGERDAANDVMRVYDDLDRLWEYSYSSPSGAFFDASTDGGSLLNMLRRYPDYTRTINDATVMAGGQVIYPSTESRNFLAAEASKRLALLGVRQPMRIAQVAPSPIAPAPKTAPKPAPRKAAPRPQSVPAHKAKPAHRPAPKVAQARPIPPKPRPVEPVPQPAPKPTPQPAPAPVTATVATAPPPVTATVQPAPAPAATQTAAAEATESGSKQTSANSRPSEPAPKQGGGRVNLLFAVILIVVGIGVLIVLLRASD